MKKDRNSFFSQFGSYGYNTNPMMNNIPNTNDYNNYNYNQDLESRINKIERELNRIDSRLSKLESMTLKSESTTTNTDYNFANSMYMV